MAALTPAAAVPPRVHDHRIADNQKNRPAAEDDPAFLRTMHPTVAEFATGSSASALTFMAERAQSRQTVTRSTAAADAICRAGIERAERFRCPFFIEIDHFRPPMARGSNTPNYRRPNGLRKIPKAVIRSGTRLLYRRSGD
jgi:hypothetical protein